MVMPKVLRISCVVSAALSSRVMSAFRCSILLVACSTSRAAAASA